MSKSKAGLLIPLFCNILGTLMIVAVIAATIPIVLPTAFGYQVFNVETGSMVPEIPIGSAVYVKEVEPQNVRPDEIISFGKDGAVITHRVVENHIVEGEFITKGDANPQEDIEAIPYRALVGRVDYHFPILGSIFVLISGTVGKIYLLLIAACGVMLNILAGRMRYARRRKIKETAKEEARLRQRKEHEEEVRRKAEEEARKVREAYAVPGDPSVEGADGLTEDEIEKLAAEGTAAGSVAGDTAAASDQSSGNRSGKRKKHTVRKVIMVVLLIIFLGAGGMAGSVLLQYHNSDALYAEAAGQYSKVVESRRSDVRSSQIPAYLLTGWNASNVGDSSDAAQDVTSNTTDAVDYTDPAVQAGDEVTAVLVDLVSEETGDGNYVNEDGLIVMRDDSQDQTVAGNVAEDNPVEDWGKHAKAPLDVAPEVKDQYRKDLDPALLQAEKKYLRDLRLLAPIRIDFDSLLEANEDVKGWIYCDDTNINYPVLHGETNNTYLRHTYDGNYNIAGSIFIETDNDPDFKDYNTIVYGHHMNDGSMFAGLDQWADQEYYEKHPVMWILTPEQDYMLVLVAGQHTSAYSDMYTLFHEPDEEFQEYIREAIANSDFKTDVIAPLDKRYVMISTCAYIFDNARYVIHGLLVPADSAGGKPLW